LPNKHQKPNAIKFEAQLRKNSSASSRHSNAELLFSPLVITENQQCYRDDKTIKLDAAGSQT
jgi:hypothetical protein